MFPFTVAIAICWILFWLYWIISALGSKKNSAPNMRQFFGTRAGLIGLAAVLALLFDRLPHSLKNYYLTATKNEVVLVLGFMVFLLGTFLAVWARVYLGKNWGMPMTQKQDPALVTMGPYRSIRHPIYSGILLMMLGSGLDINPYWLLVFIVAAAYFIYSAIVEEQLMMKQFPVVYPAYKSKTKMFIPFVL